MKKIAASAYLTGDGARNGLKNSRRLLAALGAVAALGLAGCGNLNSIHRPLHTAGGTGALIDAKQRAIIVGERTEVVSVTRMQEQAKGQSKVAVDMKEHVRRYVTCAEPSPDAMSAYAAEFAGELALSPLGADGTNRSVAIKSALQEAAAHIGMRTPSIQLLRDAMYRVCEAHANGAIDNDQYELLMRRYQRQIVAMMAIESLTQAGRVPAITLATQGSTGGERALSEWMGEIDTQQNIANKHQALAETSAAAGKAAGIEIEAAQPVIDAADTEITAADKALAAIDAEVKAGKLKQDEADEKKKEPAKKKAEAQKKRDEAVAKKTAAEGKKGKADAGQKAAEAEMRKANARIASLQDHMAGGASLTGRTAAEVASASVTTSAELIAEVAPFVLQIADRVLDVDDTAALCFIHYKREPKNPQDNPLQELCKSHMAYMQKVRDVRTQVLDACVKKAGGDSDELGKCVGLFASLPKGGQDVAKTLDLPIEARALNITVKGGRFESFKQWLDEAARKK